jgi:putative ABC transport system permease protein
VETIRNLTRHKLRNGLTIAGIVIGVLALTTMGALAERTNFLFEGGVRFYEDHITVSAGGQFGTAPIRLDKADEVARVDGVAAVFPVISVRAKAEIGEFSFGPPATIVATKPGYDRYSRFQLRYAHGGPLSERGGEVVLGADFANELGVRPGDTLTLPIPPRQPQAGYKGYRFTVVGILEKTLTAPDGFAYVSFADGQRLLADSLPAALRDRVDSGSLANGLDVFGEPGVDLDQLARRINEEVREVRAFPPSEIVRAFQAGAAIFTAITTGSAILALVVGGLSIINTMSMAVVERFREIGLKKALGARTLHILGEFLVEAAAIGLIGGALGILLGWALVSLINAATAQQNLSLFLLTPRLVLIAGLFSIGLGALAGLIPAIRAARLDPVVALRYE